MSGGYNYADAYSKYKQGVSPDSDFEKYVDSQGDLKNAWSLIADYQAGKRGADLAKYVPLITQNGLSPEQQADYWIKRGVTSKAAFGRAHAAEDESLRSGTYRGGTEVKPWKGDTRFEKWDKGKDKKVVDETPTGPIKHDNPYFPMLTQDYSSPAAQDWSAYMGGGNPALTGNEGLLYQPWTSDYQTAAGIPDNLWNYAPPEGIDYAVRYNNPLTGALDMNLMPAGSATTGGGTTTGGTTGVRPGSDKAKDLANGIVRNPDMYDADGNWVGAEGGGIDAQGFETDPSGRRTGGQINDPLGIGNKILGLMGAWPAQVQRDKAAWTGGLTPDQSAAMAAAKAAEAGTGFADMYGGGAEDPTSEGFVDWDQ